MEQVLQIAGALAVLVAFSLVQAGRVRTTSRGYLVANLAGSAVLAADALAGKQWGFLLLEAVWVIVSAAALVRRTPNHSPSAT